jgi:hypothetical protein
MIAVAGHRWAATRVLTGQNPTVSTAGFEPVSEGGLGHRDVGAVPPRVPHVGRVAWCARLRVQGSDRGALIAGDHSRPAPGRAPRRGTRVPPGTAVGQRPRRSAPCGPAVCDRTASSRATWAKPCAREGPGVTVELQSWSSRNDGGTNKVRAGAAMRCSHSSEWGRSASPRWLGVWSAPRRLGASRSSGSSHGRSGQAASSRQRDRPVPHGQHRRGTVPVSPCGAPSVGRA